jgi:cytochrome b subunit of formate dehydrogenase
VNDAQNAQLSKQVERWDLYARIVPTIFLILSAILIFTGIIDFAAAFYVGLGLFAATAVSWWFWTIYTIRHLVKTLSDASTGLKDVRDEFRHINKEIRNIRDEQE